MALPPGMHLAAIGEREVGRPLSLTSHHTLQDPRDVVIFHPRFQEQALTSLDSLPDGSVIGTSSQRRIACPLSHT
jgi:porphobilinogen deaminase